MPAGKIPSFEKTSGENPAEKKYYGKDRREKTGGKRPAGKVPSAKTSLFWGASFSTFATQVSAEVNFPLNLRLQKYYPHKRTEKNKL